MSNYYWLKLKTTFFKRHDIQYIESLPNGKEIVLFYIKLMVESIDHKGSLRFSEEVPYTEKMISVITNEDINFVHEAMKALEEVKMIVIDENQTIIITGVDKLIGSATDSDAANRMRRMRAKRAEEEANSDNVTECYEQNVRNKTDALRNVTNKPLRDIDIDIEKDIDIDKEKSIKEKTTRFLPPTLDDISSYCLERNNSVDPQRFFDFYQSKGWMVGKNKMKDWKAAVRNWETRSGTKSAPSSSSNPFTSSNNPFTELRRQEGYT